MRPALLVLLLLLFGTAPPAMAAPAAEGATTVLTAAEFKPFFVEAVCASAPWPREKLAVENFAARPASLTVPAGKVVYRLTTPPQGQYLGGKVLTVMVLVDGKEAGSVQMSGDLQLYDEVLCTTRRLARHDILTAGDVKLVRQNVSMLGSDLARDPAASIGKRLTVSLRAGSVLRTSQIEAPPLVRRGDLVTIVARTDHLRVTAPGEARDSGALGEMVRVKNLMSRKALHAKVVASGTVEVDF